MRDSQGLQMIKKRGYDKFRYVVAYNSIENNLLISDYDNPEKIGNYTIDMDGIHYNEKRISSYQSS